VSLFLRFRFGRYQQQAIVIRKGQTGGANDARMTGLRALCETSHTAIGRPDAYQAMARRGRVTQPLDERAPQRHDKQDYSLRFRHFVAVNCRN
jgi:hypothetical protein